MLGLFSKVTPYVKPKPKAEVPRPDNIIFRLHYRTTFSILLVACIMVSSYSYIDSSDSAIQCMMDKGTGIRPEIINRYCWIMSTFTLPKHFKGNLGEDFIHYGVGPHKNDDERIYHAYYQWVPLMLALQAVMFYAPHWIWKAVEGGRMKNIIKGLNLAIDDDSIRKDTVKRLADYMKVRMQYLRDHQMWAAKFFFCESLNFVNVVAQIFITDKFLGGEFLKYGTEVLNFPDMAPEDRVDPMSRIFPRMTKCIFHKFGGSGTIQRFDAMCVLGMNIVNEKIYIFLWFWFIILAILTGGNLLLRIVQLFSSKLRNRMVKLENMGYLDQNVGREQAEAVVSTLSYSDWLILYYLAQSMDKTNFGALISQLADDLPEYPSSYEDDDQVDSEEKDPDKNVTPPPGFDDHDFYKSNTMKLKSVFSFKKGDK